MYARYLFSKQDTDTQKMLLQSVSFIVVVKC